MIPGRVVGWAIRVRLLRWAGMDLGETVERSIPGASGRVRPARTRTGVVVETIVNEPEIGDAVAALDGILRAFAVERWTLDDIDLGGEEDDGRGGRRRREATFAYRECAREIVMPGCPGGEA